MSIPLACESGLVLRVNPSFASALARQGMAQPARVHQLHVPPAPSQLVSTWPTLPLTWLSFLDQPDAISAVWVSIGPRHYSNRPGVPELA